MPMESMDLWSGMNLIYQRQERQERNMKCIMEYLGLLPASNDPEFTVNNCQTDDRGAVSGTESGEN